MRRRGYTPAAIRNFCDRIGVAKANSMVDMALLEYCVREDLNKTAPRVMGVLNPLKVIITNYPEGKQEMLEAENNPEDPSMGHRRMPFGRVLYIEKDDFREDPPKKWFRLAPGREVRLKHAYYITCREVIKDPQTDDIVELRCTYDPETRGGWSQDGRKVKGTLHWVSAEHAVTAEVRLYDPQFTKENPNEVEEGRNFTDYINSQSLTVLENCRLEPSLGQAEPGDRFQFLRLGYFCVDTRDSQPGRPVFNRTVTLRDTWAKIERGQAQKR
jgi:glutaminyl-tRNA synthetase